MRWRTSIPEDPAPAPKRTGAVARQGSNRHKGSNTHKGSDGTEPRQAKGPNRGLAGSSDSRNTLLFRELRGSWILGT